MAYRVEVTETAESDIDEAITFIAKDSHSATARWHAELWQLILSLKEMPSRFPILQDSDELGHQYRSVVHYSHRVIFRIEDSNNTVYVVRVYHGARRPLTTGGF